MSDWIEFDKIVLKENYEENKINTHISSCLKYKFCCLKTKIHDMKVKNVNLHIPLTVLKQRIITYFLTLFLSGVNVIFFSLKGLSDIKA